MQLFVGLGNPGNKYVNNRHNLGYLIIDKIALNYNFNKWQNRHRGVVSKGSIEESDIFLLKPQTFMNLSGTSVAETVRFYKLKPSDVLVFYDEIDLNPGKIRIKLGGSSAGHNGVRSIEDHIGSDFYRIRIGVGRPEMKKKVESYVLNDFSSEELSDWVSPLTEIISKKISPLILGDHSVFLNRVALEMQNHTNNLT